MFSKIRNFFQNKKEFEEKRIRKIKTIEEKWAEFENRSTYLAYQQKGDFVDEINSISKIPWKYKFDLRYYFGDKLFKEKIGEIKSRILNFNKNFIERRLEDYSSFFEGLDDDLKYL